MKMIFPYAIVSYIVIMLEIHHVFISNIHLKLARVEREQYYLPVVVFAIYFCLKMSRGNQ